MIRSMLDRVSFTHDHLCCGFGFYIIENVLKHLKTTSADNFSISTSAQEPITDLGSVGTIERSKLNTKSNHLPKYSGNTLHIDIVFRSRVAISGVKYALFIVDKATCEKYFYRLRNLKGYILDQLQQLCADIEFVPRKFMCECDNK